MRLFENIYHTGYLNHIDEMNVSKTNSIESNFLQSRVKNITCTVLQWNHFDSSQLPPTS